MITNKKNKRDRDLPKTHTISVRLDDIAYKNLLDKQEMTGNNKSEIINDMIKNKRLKPLKKLRDIIKEVADIDTRINKIEKEIKSEEINKELSCSRAEFEKCKDALFDLIKWG